MNYKELNAKIMKDKSSIPIIDGLLNELYRVSLELRSDYF